MAEMQRPNPLLHRLRAWAAVETLGKLTDRELLRRYAEVRDEQAFQVIMERHGSMVLRACRRFLGNQQDAEDAFQATFFVLARKAGLRRWEQSVANWLYSVACCVSRTARRASARRKSHEQHSPSKAAGTPLEELNAQEFMAVFDEELSQLADTYRAVLVQIYLEGKSQDEAARALGLSLDAVRKRLERGRNLLEARLTRRGLSLSVALTAILVSEKAATAVVPTALAAGTLWAVRLYETGQAAVGAASAPDALAATVLNSMMVGHVRPLVLVAGVLLLVAGGSAGLTVMFIGKPAAEPVAWETPPSSQVVPLRPALPKAVPGFGDPLHSMLPVAGRVLNAEGQPVPFAAVTALLRRPFRPGEQALRDEVVARGQADEQGMFRLRVPANFPTWFPERQVVLVAKAPGRVPFTTLVRLAEQGATEVELRLTAAEQIVRGRLLAPDGVAASGVRLRVIRLGDVARETVQGAAENDRPDLGWPGPVVSDTEGRFALSGIDPAQGVWLQVEDDRYAPDAFELRGADKAAEIRLQAAQVLEGRIIAADTGKPVAGVKLTAPLAGRPIGMPGRFTVSDYLSISTRALPPTALDGVSGADGRFRLRPPARPKTIIEFHPPADSPYLAVGKEVDWSEAVVRSAYVWGGVAPFENREVDRSEGVVRKKLAVALPRGVMLHGRVVDEDGVAVAGASVQFSSPAPGNPAYRPDVIPGAHRIVLTGKDGRFRLTVPAGPVRLIAHGPTHEYRAQALRYWRLLEKSPEHWGWREPLPAEQWGYTHAQEELKLTPAENPPEVCLRLVRGQTVAGRVVGPDGEAVQTAVLLCSEKVSPLLNGSVQPLPVRAGRYELPGCVAGRVYPVLLFDAVHGWGAAVDLTAGPDSAPEVKLARCGSARVRLVDGRGRPLAGRGPRLRLLTERSFAADKPPLERAAEGDYSACYDARHYCTDPASDREGWLTLPALIPGARYALEFTDVEGMLRHTSEFRVEPGEQLLLPDLAIGDRE